MNINMDININSNINYGDFVYNSSGFTHWNYERKGIHYLTLTILFHLYLL